MKKLISLILITALVGCAEYSSHQECMLKERQKIQSEINERDIRDLYDYCTSLTPKKCKADAKKHSARMERGEIDLDEWLDEWPKSCAGWDPTETYQNYPFKLP